MFNILEKDPGEIPDLAKKEGEETKPPTRL